MGIPSNKAELLLAIDTNFGKLLKALQAVPESKAQELAMEGHSKSTSMSVADLVAYLQWMAEPAQNSRVRIGVWVLLFLAAFTIVAWRLNASFWKDVK